MNQQEIVAKVGELAGRVGYPTPTISWVPGVVGEHCILLQDDGRTLVLHDRVDEEYSEQERDLLIAQELIQARLGGPRQRKWIKTGETVIGFALGIFSVLVARQSVSSVWLAYLLAALGGYAAWMVVRVVLVSIWTRWFTRRSDRALAEVVGRDQVVAWLREMSSTPVNRNAVLWARWVLHGAPPLAAERLRMLGKGKGA